ncbi:hypothetical protein V865_000780 [Kwoniella europaea PYCC6329]|uniref:Uncharacterized protein n=1 Tax=Kwoniella europaea PYCC6329 TaxID=1423913 RepID=A0AAX4KB59_9TREE
MSSILAYLYIPASIYIARFNPSVGFLTVGKEVGYLLLQGLLILVLGILSALSTKEEICTSIKAEPGHFGYSTQPFRCQEKLASAILSFLHLLLLLCWLALLFISVHRYRGHEKRQTDPDGFEIPIHHFLSSKRQLEEEERHDLTPIESLTNTTKTPFSPFSPGITKEQDGDEISLHDSSPTRSNKHTSEPWRISSLPLPDLKFHFDSVRNSAKSNTSASATASGGGGFGFSFSNPIGGSTKKTSTLLPTLESARNSVKSWKKDDDLESMRRDHKRIESWRISPIPLPDLNLGFDTKSTKTQNHQDRDKDRLSVKSGLRGLTLEDARNSIQSLKSNSTIGARDSLKSQVSTTIKPVEKAYTKSENHHHLEVHSLRETGGYRSTFQFRPELETHRDSIETLRRDPKRIESWRISPIPLPNIRMSFDHQKKEAKIVPHTTVGTNTDGDEDDIVVIPGLSDNNERVQLRDSTDVDGDLSLAGGLGRLSVGGGGGGIHNKRLSNVRNSAQSGFSLQHARQSVRSQIGEVLETHADNASTNSKDRRVSWGDSYSSLGFGKSTFSVNFDGTGGSGSKRNSGNP